MLDGLVSSAGFLSSGGSIGGDLTITGDLTVEGSSTYTYDESVDGGAIFNESGNDVDFRIESDGNANMFFVDGGNDRIGIGTAAPGHLLDVEASATGAVAVNAKNTASGTANYGQVRAASDTVVTSILSTASNFSASGSYHQAAGALDSGGAGGFALMATHGSGTLRFATGGTTERMRIDSSGNVGIGNTVPGSHLEVSETDNNTTVEISTWSTAATHTSQLRFQKSASATINTMAATAANEDLGKIVAQGVNTSSVADAAAQIFFEGDAAPDGDAVPGRISFWTSDAATLQERMRIDDSGNVGIGATPVITGFTPGLHIEGTVPGLIMRDSTSSGQATQFLTQYLSGGNVQIMFDDAGTYSIGDADDAAGTDFRAAIKLDVNSRISLSNNDAGGTGGADSTTGNTVIGYLAGAAIADGTKNNSLFGHKAGNALNDGDWNVIIGQGAGLLMTTGHENVIIGQEAGDASVDMGKCVVIGSGAMGSGVATQDGTIAIGYTALTLLTSGAGNTAIGYQAADSVGTGGNNTIVGHQALATANTAALNNTALGSGALGSASSSTTDSNIAIGMGALTGGSGNLTGCIAIGKTALDDTTSNAQTGTIAIGHQALTALTSGAGNTAVGYTAGALITTGGGNTYIGSAVGDATHVDSSHNTIMGETSFGGSHTGSA